MLMSFYATAEREAEEDSVKKKVCSILLQNVNQWFDVFEDARIICMAKLLDPCFKNSGFWSSGKEKLAVSLLAKELKKVYQINQPEQTQEEVQVAPPAKKVATV